jgi:hypothetical protein
VWLQQVATWGKWAAVLIDLVQSRALLDATVLQHLNIVCPLLVLCPLLATPSSQGHRAWHTQHAVAPSLPVPPPPHPAIRLSPLNLHLYPYVFMYLQVLPEASWSRVAPELASAIAPPLAH